MAFFMNVDQIYVRGELANKRNARFIIRLIFALTRPNALDYYIWSTRTYFMVIHVKLAIDKISIFISLDRVYSYFTWIFEFLVYQHQYWLIWMQNFANRNAFRYHIRTSIDEVQRETCFFLNISLRILIFISPNGHLKNCKNDAIQGVSHGISFNLWWFST